MIQTLLLGFFLLQINLLPLLFIPFFDLSYEFPKYIIFFFISTILFVLHVIKIYKSSEITLPSKPVLLPIIAFTAIYFVSTFFSISPITSIFGLREVYSGGFIYFLLLLINFYTAFTLQKFTDTIIKNIVITAATVSLFGIFEYIFHFFHTLDWLYRINGTIGHPVRLSFYLLSVLPLGIMLLIKEKKSIYKLVFSIASGLTLISFLLTFTRSSFIVFVFMFALSIPFFLHNKKILINNKFFSIVFIICIIIFGNILIRSIPISYNGFLKSSFSPRLTEWSNVISGLSHSNIKRLLIGTGPDTIYFSYRTNTDYFKNHTIESTFSAPLQVRNQYLHYLSVIGIIGICAYVWLMYSITRILMGRKKSLLTYGIGLSLIGIMIHSVFYYQTENVLFIFWILNGLIVNQKFKVNQQSLLKIKKFTVIFLIIAIISFFYIAGNFLAEYISHTSSSPNQLKIAFLLSPYERTYAIQLSNAYLRETVKEKNVDPIKMLSNYEESVKYAKISIELAPYDRKNLYILSNLYYWGGINIDKKYNQKAIDILEKLINIDPRNYYYWDQLGLVYLNLGELDKAMGYFKYVQILNPNLPGTYLHKGEVFKQQGKLDEAILQYRIALKLYPNWAFALDQIDLANQLLKIKNNQ